MFQSENPEIEKLFRLLESPDLSKVELAFKLAKALDNPVEWEQMMEKLLKLYQSAFRKRKTLNAKLVHQLIKIEEFDCAKNRINSIPNSINILFNIKVLNCSHNKILNLPESIGYMNKLFHLDCEYNELSSLPQSIGLLQNLENLTFKIKQAV